MSFKFAKVAVIALLMAVGGVFLIVPNGGNSVFSQLQATSAGSVNTDDKYRQTSSYTVQRDSVPLDQIKLPTEATAAGPKTEPNPLTVQKPHSLNDSNQSISSLVLELAPSIQDWLIPEEQIRKWVMTVDMVADHRVPKTYLPISRSHEPFMVDDSINGATMAHENFKRLSPLLQGLTSIEPSLLVRYYHAWSDLFEEAYAELGKGDKFSTRLNLAIENVLDIQPIPTQASLSRNHVLYQYDDLSLENSTELHKLMWRLGPENHEAIHEFLSQIKSKI